jgi:hypothetical protein
MNYFHQIFFQSLTLTNIFDILRDTFSETFQIQRDRKNGNCFETSKQTLVKEMKMKIRAILSWYKDRKLLNIWQSGWLG